MPQGMAPGPAPAEPTANILFTVSAPRAVLTGSALTLMGVSPVVQFYTSESKAGVYTTGVAPECSQCLCVVRHRMPFQG